MVDSALCTKLFASPFQADGKLEQAGQEDTDGESEAHPHHAAVAMEEVDELAVGHLGHEIEHDVGHCVVDPMKDYARNDGVGAIVHPAEQQSDEGGMGKLRQVQVYSPEQDS